MKRGLTLVLVLLFCISSFSVSSVIEVEEVDNNLEVEDILTREEVSEGLTRYVYGAGMVAAVKDDEIVYFHRDRLGTNSLTTDSDGLELNKVKNLPFGQKIVNDGIKYSFTDKELDESDLYHFGARYYDSNLGRFTSVDMIQKGTPYSYVRNNPFKYTDPTGLQAVDDQQCVQGCHNSWNPSDLLSQGELDILSNSPGFKPDAYLQELENRARLVTGYAGPILPEGVEIIERSITNWRMSDNEKLHNKQVRASNLVRTTMRKQMKADVKRLTMELEEAEARIVSGQEEIVEMKDTYRLGLGLSNSGGLKTGELNLYKRIKDGSIFTLGLLGIFGNEEFSYFEAGGLDENGNPIEIERAGERAIKAPGLKATINANAAQIRWGISVSPYVYLQVDPLDQLTGGVGLTFNRNIFKDFDASLSVGGRADLGTTDSDFEIRAAVTHGLTF